MKKILVVLIVMLTAGCGGMGGMRSSGGYSDGTGRSGSDNIYSPNFNPAFQRMDSSFQPYFGG